MVTKSSTLFLISILSVSILIFFNVENNDIYAHHVIKEINVAERPMKMSLDEPLLFVSNLGEPVISIISTVSNNIVSTINTTEGIIDVEGINDKNKVYAATFQSGEIEVYDITTKELITTIPIPDSVISYPQRLADTVLVTPTIVTGGWSLDYNPNNEMLYVANLNTDEITVIDTNTDKVVKNIPVPANPSTVKVDPLTNKILVTSIAANKLTFISGETNEILDTIKIGISPWNIAINENEHLAYITNRNSFHLSVVNTIDHKIIGNIPIGEQAQSIAVDENENKIYVSFDEQDKIVKINGKNNEVETIIELNNKIPSDIVVDPISHNLYASLKFNNDILIIGPETYSIKLPVVTKEAPIIFVGDVILHGQDVQTENLVLQYKNLTSFAMLDNENNTLTMEVTSLDGGELQISLPRSILDSTENGVDTEFLALLNNEEIRVKETKLKDESTTLQDRVITVFIPKGDQRLEIKGTTSLNNTLIQFLEFK
ncbi:MAG: hypothetical protein ACPKQO_02750 [Nitrososphaeraceae archaeon]